jgi:superoxide dismutase, Fe-Mn family
LEAIVKAAPAGALFNSAAQAWNHAFYWKSMQPEGSGSPTGEVAEAMPRAWGSFGKVHEPFAALAVATFGSGWTWLVKKADGSLAMTNTARAQTPLAGSDKPLLTLDVWEHAHPIDHRNHRPRFVEAFLGHLVNRKFAAGNFAWRWADAGRPPQGVRPSAVTPAAAPTAGKT